MSPIVISANALSKVSPSNISPFEDKARIWFQIMPQIHLRLIKTSILKQFTQFLNLDTQPLSQNAFLI